MDFETVKAMASRAEARKNEGRMGMETTARMGMAVLVGVRVVFEDGDALELAVTEPTRQALINQFMGVDDTNGEFLCIPHFWPDNAQPRTFACLRDSIKYLA